jgi:hypothetical protein
VTQPEYVPITPEDRIRPVLRLPAPRRWKADRPAEIRAGRRPAGAWMGTPGPDQGYALTLADRFSERLALTAGEKFEDAVAGCLGVVLRRAALFDRAPVIHDWEVAFTLWGYMGGAPDDLVAYRRPLFQAAAHDYWVQRAISDLVSDDTLRLSPAQISARLSDWRQLVEPDPTPVGPGTNRRLLDEA